MAEGAPASAASIVASVTDTSSTDATEASSIERSSGPASAESIADDLCRLGLGEGDVVLAHSSLSALGWVAGGAQAVVEALMAAVGESGTIVMPTQSGHLTDPIRWKQPPIPAEWIERTRATLPAYDRYLTPTRSMGQVVECFRQHRATVRSPHPTVSFAANGPRAEEICGEHPLTPSFGEPSPLGRLYELDAKVLLLGVTHANDTSFHLAEHRADWSAKSQATFTEGAPVLVDGRREWVTYDDLVADDSDFARIGDALAETDIETVGEVHCGTARLARQRALVDFAAGWMTANR